jgi:hypothetical protein
MKFTQNSLVILALGLAIGAQAAPSAPKYKLEIITGLGITGGRATGISSNGVVVGVVNTGGATTAPMLFDGSAKVVSVPSGFTNVIPTGVNGSGRISGYGTKSLGGSSSTTTALYWTSFNTTPVQILPFDGYTTGKSWLNDVNDSSLTVGAANGWMVNNVNTINMQAMYYNAPANQKVNFQNLTGSATGYANFNAINDQGMMVGSSLAGDGKTHGVYRYGSSLTLVTDPAGTTNGAELTDANNFFNMVGTSWASVSQSRAFYRTQFGTPVFIPRTSPASGDDANNAQSINDNGYVVGQCEEGTRGLRGYIWDGTNSYSLNGVIQNLGGNSIVNATEINDRNEIAATVRNAAGVDFAAKLTPYQTISLQLNLGDWSASPHTVECTWEIRNDTNVLVDSGTFTPNILGGATIETSFSGLGTLRVKPSHWLSKHLVLNTDFFESVSGTMNFLNGDIDKDNEVSILDYLMLSGDFEKDSSMPGWSLPDGASRSDLDGDNVVSILDYLILSSNFEKSGE